MATRAEEERKREEQGERFLKLMTDQFSKTREGIIGDIMPQIMPRPEIEARMLHQDQLAEQALTAIRDLTAVVSNIRDTVPIRFQSKEDAQRDAADADKRLTLLETRIDTVQNRTFDRSYDELGKRFSGDISVERGWRRQAHDQSTQLLTWLVGGAAVLLTIAANIILALALRGH